MATHCPDTLIQLFNDCFKSSESTVLVRGGDEPIYLPCSHTQEMHEIHFAHGFFQSALHEISHWCIAGAARRKQVDYGYWYEPDGRNRQTQAQFAAVESRPQAIEWVFSKACGKRFFVSLDNLSLELSDFDEFKAAIMEQLNSMKKQGLPPRALIFQQALAKHFEQPLDFTHYDFQRAELD